MSDEIRENFKIVRKMAKKILKEDKVPPDEREAISAAFKLLEQSVIDLNRIANAIEGRKS